MLADDQLGFGLVAITYLSFDSLLFFGTQLSLVF